MESVMVKYEEYIHSLEWRRKRAEYFSSGRPKFCQGCRDKSIRTIHLHHKTYERLGNEDLDDLVPVCQDCHQMIHDRHKFGDLSLWDATDLVLGSMRERQHRKPKPLVLVKTQPKARTQKALRRLQRQGELGRRRTSKIDTKWESDNAEYRKLRDMETERRRRLRSL